MIVSYKHNYIYFRPKKTGSSTIAEVLRDSLGEGDISDSTSIPGDIEVDRRSLHLKAVEVQSIVTPEFWQRAYKFASERHPYEKAVSLAFFRLGKQQARRGKDAEYSSRRLPSLLQRVVEGGEYKGFDYYSVDGKPVVDEFIRHETLEADLRRIAGRLDIPVPEHLPRTKASFRLDPRPAGDILSEAQKQIIGDVCREEFELLGYSR